MMKVMPYDPSHEEVYNAFIMKTEPKTEVFSAKPTETDRQKHFETVTTLIRPHRRSTWTVQLYLPGGANVHPIY